MTQYLSTLKFATRAGAIVALATTFAAISAATAPANADDDPITKESQRSVGETIDALQKMLVEKGIKIMARVDHAEGAKGAGLELPPTQLLIFGNPKLGTPLMQSNPLIGLDLPMKALAWQDADGKVYLSYTAPADLKDRYDIDDRDEVFAKMTKALDIFTTAATTKPAQ